MTFAECRALLGIDDTWCTRFESTEGLLDSLARLGTTLATGMSDQNGQSVVVANMLSAIVEAARDYKNREKDIQSGETAGEGEAETAHAQLHDMRFTDVYLHNFRNFPHSSDNVRFGLKLHEDANPAPMSLFAIGSNGSGKSSFYGALEYKCTGKVGEGLLRNAVRDFGENVDTASRHSSEDVVMVCRGGVPDLSNYTLDSFFCSENDLISMIRLMPDGKDGDWAPFFADISGLRVLNDLIDYLWILESLDWDVPELQLNDEFDPLEVYRNAELIMCLDMLRGNRLKRNEGKGKLCKSLVSVEKVLSSKENPADDIEIKKQRKEEYRELASSLAACVFRKQSFWYPLTRDISEEIEHLKTLVDTTQVTENAKKKKMSLEGDNPGKPSLAVGDTGEEEAIDYDKVLVQCRTIVLSIQGKIQETLSKLEAIDNQDQSEEQWKADSINAMLGMIIRKRVPGASVPKAEVGKIRNNLIQERLRLVKEIVNAEFVKRISGWFKDSEFLSDQESLEFDLSFTDKLVFRTKIGEKAVSDHKRYYNTFRLKLLALMLRVETVLAVMKRDKFLFPIIMDDIFYSSDYENKFRLKHFFISVFEHARQVLGEKSHLQMILLTHDEQIMKVCRNAAQSNNVSPAPILARFLPYSYCLDGPKIQVEGDASYYNLCISI